MSHVVLIHGIGQEQRTADDLEAEWLPSLAGGVRVAGKPELADQLWRSRHNSSIHVRMAAYGDLFLDPDQMGAETDLADLTSDQQELAEALATEWLRRAAKNPDHPDSAVAQTELAYLDEDQEEMGLLRRGSRSAVNGLSHLPWFANAGMSFAQRFINTALRQVTRYLTEPELQHSIDSRVLAHLDEDTRIVVGHSLGSVIAYQVAANHLQQALPVLVTLGSPLGLRTVVYHRLTPQPPTYPSLVHRWVNLADRNDLVAAEPDLTNQFGAGRPATAIFDTAHTVDNGARPHQATYYLGKRSTGQAVATALSSREDTTT